MTGVQTCALPILCRLSLSPDPCVRQTENVFARWGAGSLVFAKFVPGLSTIAPPLAGIMGLGWWRFMAYNTLGAALWVCVGVGIGLAFHAQVDALLGHLAEMGGLAGAGLLAALASWVTWRWLQRHRFMQALRMARITPDELHALMTGGADPLVLDVRATLARDARALFAAGYTLTQIHGFDLFPTTAHVETVAVFDVA